MTDLNPHIVAYCRKQRGMRFNPAYGDFATAVKSAPALIAEANAERQRLEDEHAGRRGGASGLFDRDVESRDRHRALVRMLNDANSVKETP